jgi:hypothetical protein
MYGTHDEEKIERTKRKRAGTPPMWLSAAWVVVKDRLGGGLLETVHHHLAGSVWNGFL